MPEPLHIHMVAICGTGMGSLASLLKRAGHVVSGSDRDVFPPMSDQLRDAGITVKIGFGAANLDPELDLVIVGNAVSKGHIEVEAARQRGLPLLSMADALKDLFLARREPMVVTGTHGKTTTSFLLAHILEAAGRDPGMFIGGVLRKGHAGARIGSGREFVVEGDEYDNVFWDKTPKFLHYAPNCGIITSIELDHVDIYSSIEEIEMRFAEFAALIPTSGHLIVEGSCPRIRRAAAACKGRVETYGVGLDDHWRAARITDGPERNSFVVLSPDGNAVPCSLPMPGAHNAINAVAAIALATRRGVELQQAVESLANFQGVRRRQEVRGVADGVTIIDDFAHHPTKVSRTLQALHQRHLGRKGKLWAIYEPRTATSCRKVHQHAYESAFDAAQRVIIAANARAASIPAEDRFDPERLVAGLRGLDADARYIPDVDAIVACVAREAQPGDVIVVLSNGGFGGLHDLLLEALVARAKAKSQRKSTPGRSAAG